MFVNGEWYWMYLFILFFKGGLVLIIVVGIVVVNM